MRLKFAQFVFLIFELTDHIVAPLKFFLQILNVFLLSNSLCVFLLDYYIKLDILLFELLLQLFCLWLKRIVIHKVDIKLLTAQGLLLAKRA
jgi:hypothetical protein